MSPTVPAAPEPIDFSRHCPYARVLLGLGLKLKKVVV